MSLADKIKTMFLLVEERAAYIHLVNTCLSGEHISLQMKDESVVLQHPRLFLQNQLRRNSRFSSFPGLLNSCKGPLRLCAACAFGQVSAPFSCREGLTGFPEREKAAVFDVGFCPEKLPFSCRKALPGMRRGRSRRATGPSLQCNKGPAARSGGPYGKTIGAALENDGVGAVCKWLYMRKLKIGWIKAGKMPGNFILACLRYLRPRRNYFRKSLLS